MFKLSLSAMATLSAAAAIVALSACGQSDNRSVSEAQPTQGTVPEATQNQNTGLQPLNPGVVQPDGSVNYDQPGDRNVTVNAPFSDTRVDRDTGSIHVDAPFVHIDKAGRGQKMHIDIGGDSSDNMR